MSSLYPQATFRQDLRVRAYVQWQRLSKSYRLFTAAMKNAAPALSDELHPLQYQVFGQVRYNEFMNMWCIKLLLMKLPHLLTAHILFFSGFVI